MSYPDHMKDAKTLREEACRYERLAEAADSDSDDLDAANCRGHAAYLRSLARRKEIK